MLQTFESLSSLLELAFCELLSVNRAKDIELRCSGFWLQISQPEANSDKELANRTKCNQRTLPLFGETCEKYPRRLISGFLEVPGSPSGLTALSARLTTPTRLARALLCASRSRYNLNKGTSHQIGRAHAWAHKLGRDPRPDYAPEMRAELA